MTDPILNLYTKNAYVHVYMLPGLEPMLIYNVKNWLEIPQSVSLNMYRIL